tara:strand:- start:365 stop:877 length:513 start_codon:yes stop_codon:yes gene_type:complete
MNSKKNLVFLGMMGSGKSSIGFSVAKKLNLKFIDIDNIIEKEVGMKIADIFKDKGENYFRILEEKNTLKVLNFNNNVISLGGGAFMNNKIRKKVLSNNFSFWLNWNAETLLIRIKKNKKRPLAFNSSDTELMSLIKSRSKIYSKAQIKINCNNLKKSEIIEKILKIYEPN